MVEAHGGGLMKKASAFLREHAPEMLEDVKQLVSLESPSHNPGAINRLQDLNQTWFGSLGEVNRHAGATGDTLHLRMASAHAGRVLLLAHVDTVYPTGSWGELWRVADGRAYGPGAYDMKGGIVQAKWALLALHALGAAPHTPLTSC